MPKTRFFRVAVEGATASDGRTIEKSWLTDIEKTYDPKTYSAGMNVEHVRGFTGDKPFKRMGKVLAVKTEQIDLKIGGKMKSRLALLAQVDAHGDLVALTKDGQKVYPSIEVAPNFGASGMAGLVGLAATDNPASLGTERLAFSTGATAVAIKPLVDAFKTNADNILGESVETTIEMETDAAAEEPASLFSKLLSSLGFSGTGLPVAAGAAAAATPAAASVTAGTGTVAHAAGDDKVVALLTALKADMDAGRTADRKAAADDHNTLNGQFAALQCKLDTTPASFTQRSVATGGTGRVLTDC